MAWNDWGHWLTGGVGTTKGRKFLFGSDNQMKKLPTGTPEQGQFHESILAQLMKMQQGGGGYDLAQNYFNDILQPGGEGFQKFSEPYMQQFEQKVLPQIAERFAGGGALSSSGFGQAIGGASSDLQAQLAQLFSGMQGQAAQQQYGQFNQMSNQGLNYSPFAYNEQQGSQGFLPMLMAYLVKSGMGG